MCRGMLKYVLQFPCSSQHTRPCAGGCYKMCYNSPFHLISCARGCCKMCCNSSVHLTTNTTCQVCCKMCCNSSDHITTQDRVLRYVARFVTIPLTISPHKTTCQGMLQNVLQFPCPSHNTRPCAKGCCKMCCNSHSNHTTQEHMPRDVARCVAIPLSISPHQTKWDGWMGESYFVKI